LFRKVLIALLIFLSGWVHAQGTGEKAAIRNMENGRFHKAFIILKKILRKDTTNIKATYLLGHYFFQPGNPDYQLDSAYRYSRKAFLQWQQLALQEKYRLERQGLDSLSMVKLIYGIDSAAFDLARTSNTVEGFEQYLHNFHEITWRVQAIILRDDAAFELATTQNTYLAFERYLNKYPKSRRVADARRSYDSLLYKTKTSDQQLSTYRRFLQDYPETPYRDEVELNIFQLSTASGTAQVFAEITRISGHPFGAEAAAIQNGLNDQVFFPDSESATLLLYPVLRGGLFGLMDNNGAEILAPMLKELPDQYRCGNITDEVIALPNLVINNKGKTTWEGAYDSVDDLGNGFVTIESKGKFFVVHNTGLRFYRAPVDDAKLLSGRIFAIRQQEHWGLLTLTGRIVVKPEWDDIDVIGDVLVMHKNNKVSLTTIDNVTRPDGEQKKWVEGFDAVKKINNNLLWVQSGIYQGVLDTTLNILIRLDKHRVTATSQGFLLTSSGGQSLVNQSGIESELIQQIDVKGAWIGGKKDNKWYLIEPETLRRHQEHYDSIQFLGAFAIGLRGDSAFVSTTSKKVMKQIQPVSFEFLPGLDSTGYLVITNQNKQTIYSSQGTRLFTGQFDRILSATRDYFVVQKKDKQKKDKKGMVNTQGKEILTAEYDAIGGPVNGVMSLLKGGKFGQYDLQLKQLVKPEYDKNIQGYSEGIYFVLKNGKHGLIDAKNKPLTEFTYDQVIYWTDSVALVQSGKIWSLLNFRTGKVIAPSISDVDVIRNEGPEKIYRIRQGNSYGVISNRAGTIIPVKFTDLVNIGSARQPVYFTEKHVEEASLYVVIYYDARGKFIRKEVYEQDDYERIYCSKQVAR
jgi:hypothetical protein